MTTSVAPSPISAPKDVYDAAVIGAGSGGLTVAVGLATLGKSVVVFEAAEIGGDCTNVGCIPSKSLLHESLKEDKPADDPVFARVRQKRNQLRMREEVEFGEIENLDLVFTRAKLLSPNVVEITSEAGTQTITAKNIIVSTGARPRHIEIPGLPKDRYLTNENFFEQATPPKHLAIIGAGPIGLEMAVASRRLGSEVTIIEAAPEILPSLPPEASEEAVRSLKEQGIAFHIGVTAKRFETDDNTLLLGPFGEDAVTVKLEDVDAVLVAAGRIPNSEGLGLEENGIELEKGYVTTDRKGRTAVKSVWAVGDVTLRSRTTHGANAWGRRVVKAIAFPFMPIGKDPVLPGATFTQPEIATVGDHFVDVPDYAQRLTVDMASIDRSYTDEVEHGVLILDVLRLSGKVVAATIVGPRAGDLISVVTMAMTRKIPLHKWYSVVWSYPTYASVFGKAVDMYMAETLTNIPRESRRWLGGLLRRRSQS